MSGVIVFYHGIVIRIAVYCSFCRGLKRSDRYGLLRGLPWGIQSEVRKKSIALSEVLQHDTTNAVIWIALVLR